MCKPLRFLCRHRSTHSALLAPADSSVHATSTLTATARKTSSLQGGNMNSRTLRSITAVVLFAALVIPAGLTAQDKHGQNKHHHYKLIDLGTFGGPTSTYFPVPIVQSVNNRGMVVGGADTALPDPFSPHCFFDCNIMHAFQWQDGVLNDLGALPNGFDSTALWINEPGLVMGFADNGLIDPVTGLPEQVAVVWNNGQIKDLGTLGGSFSYGNAMNDQGEVVGFALNAIPDSLSYFGLGTQAHAFRWQHGHMQDLGTLGGPDSWGAFVNERGQIAGWSYTDSIPNATTGVPTQHPFLWENGEMHDLKTLGGTLAVVGSLADAGGGAINNRGQVVGTSNLAGDQTHHPFLWDGGVLIDLGTLGGANGEAYWINDAGEIVGRADITASENHHAVLWNRGAVTDLGVAVGWPCSTANQINERGQVIISTGLCGVGGGPPLLWENGGPSVDLNVLVLPGSSLTIGDMNYINDRGEIAGAGRLLNGDGHAVLLVPCDDGHPGIEDCDYSLVDEDAATRQSPASVMQEPSATAPRTPALYGPTNDVRTMLRGRLGFGRFVGGPQQVALSGAVAVISGPIATLSPTSLAFWPEAIGTTSGAWPVTLKNTGTTNMTISRIAITGPNAGDFVQSHTCGNSLAAGASCTVSVTLKATQIGKRTGTLSVTDNAHGSPQTVSLSGTGTDVVLSPAGLIFYCVPHLIGCICNRSETATLTNVGRTTLKIGGLAISAGPFSQTNSCGASVAAGGSCSINVRWSPLKGVGTEQGLVAISDNGGASPQTLGLRGYKRCSPN
jgi:probable HAF family extracellular repeat protein